MLPPDLNGYTENLVGRPVHAVIRGAVENVGVEARIELSPQCVDAPGSIHGQGDFCGGLWIATETHGVGIGQSGARLWSINRKPCARRRPASSSSTAKAPNGVHYYGAEQVGDFAFSLGR